MITDDILIATNTTEDVGIEGVLITPLKTFKDDRGSVRKIIDDIYDHDDVKKPNIDEVAEVYLSTIKPRVVKGWHRHKVMTLNYVPVHGRMVVGLCDMRAGETYEKIAAVYLDDVDHYRMLTIPPGVWNGFRIHPISDVIPAILLNAASHVHSLDEIERIHPREFPIPFDWGDYEVAG